MHQALGRGPLDGRPFQPARASRGAPGAQDLPFLGTAPRPGSNQGLPLTPTSGDVHAPRVKGDFDRVHGERAGDVEAQAHALQSQTQQAERGAHAAHRARDLPGPRTAAARREDRGDVQRRTPGGAGQSVSK